MKRLPITITLIVVALLLVLPSCGISGGSSGSSEVLNLTPRPASIPVNTSVTFTASTTGTTNPDWDLRDAAYGTLGTPAAQAGGTTYTYTAPATPPLYTNMPYDTPGGVVLELHNTANNTYAAASFTVTAPSITVGISPTTATLVLGGPLYLTGYAIGAVNNALTAQVNGVTGGTAATGTIVPSTTGLYGQFIYTAPATMPMSGNTVTLTLVSQADPTKTASAIVTLR